jgi:hypothetical protein
MATYKVIQDIEAEDKLVGPLSFRQFVYFLIAAFLGYLSFISIAKGAAFLLILFLPPMLFCLFFCWPWTPDQPTEVWALARIRFYFKSRKRVWDQSGVKEFVTITVPKKIERNYTDGLSQTEVKSRLQTLAHTIDSRGWAVKNAYVVSPVQVITGSGATDRLLDFTAMPQEVTGVDVHPADDILDEVNNPTAYHMNEMIDASSKARRQNLMERMQAPQPAVTTQPPTAQPEWFMQQQGSLPPVVDTLPQRPKPTVNDHLKTLRPASDTPVQALEPVPATRTPQPIAAKTPAPAIPAQPDPAILNLAHDNNLDVATLAREAHKTRDLDASNGEVVISLH